MTKEEEINEGLTHWLVSKGWIQTSAGTFFHRTLTDEHVDLSEAIRLQANKVVS